MKIGLERINIQEDIAVETLLNSKMIKLVIFGVHKKAKVQAEEKDQYVWEMWIEHSIRRDW